MTYQTEVSASAPRLWAHLDEAATTSVADSGSVGGTYSVSGTVTANQTPAATLSGKSFKFAGSSYISKATGTFTSTGLTTFETWFKADTTASFTDGKLMSLVGNSRPVDVTISSNGDVKVSYHTSGFVANALATNAANGEWHHIAVTHGATVWNIYVDGVNVFSGGSNSFANTSGTVYFGSRDSSAITGWLDEPAFYTAELSAATIATHYQSAVGTPVKAQIPAMVINVSAPDPVVTATRPHAVVTVPAMTMSVTAPNAVSRIGKTVTVPAATAGVSMPDVKVHLNTSQRRYSVADRGRNTGTTHATTATIPLGPVLAGALVKFDLPVYDGLKLESAILNFHATTGGNGWANFVTEDWDETTTNSPARDEVDPNLGPAYSNPGGGVHSVNITAIANKWLTGSPNYGILIDSNSSTTAELHSREAAANLQPYIDFTFSEVQPVGVTVQVPPMTASIAMPQHRSGVGTTTTVSAGSASVSMPAPAVKTIKNPTIQVKAMTLNLQFPGGTSRNPDVAIKVDPMELWLSAPPVNQFIGYPKTIQVEGAMNLGVAMNDATVNLRTDKRIFVTNSMGVSVKMVGIYSKESDRYFKYVPSTVDADDLWLPLDEVSGTIAHDIVGTTEVGQQPDINHGEYVGNPELYVTGAYLRKAVRFDGIDDHLKINYKPYVSYFAPTADTTIEFSIKTTQLNGVLMTGNNIGVYGQTGANVSDQAEIRLVNGELALYTGAVTGGITYPVRKFVADGEWHHIVLSIPATDAPQSNQNATRPYFLAIDGKVAWQRYQAALTGRMAPSAFMARVEMVNSAPVVSQVVAGELSNVIVRTNQAISPDTAKKLYYEWSETLLIKAEPMSLSVEMKDPFKARGNAKRMIALYGLPFNLGAWPLLGEEYNYYSIFAGYYVDTMYSEISPNAHKGIAYHQVRPFKIEDYTVYPVAITGAMGGSGNPTSAPGMEKEGVRDPYTGQFLDDETGLSRFIDLDKDLAEPITEFDAITVVNYPTATPETGGFLGGGSADPFREPRQSAYALTIPQWQAARDKLRDSILSAAYRGVNLWVNEPWMAEHLGIIQGWDKHTPNDTVVVYPTGPYDLTYTNTRGRELDLAHKGPDWPTESEAYDEDLAPVTDPLAGQYKWIWQSNSKRRIVSTEPGLTNLPSFERGDMIHYRAKDRYKPHADWIAYDLLDRMNGLSVGDKLGMDMSDDYRIMGPWWSSGAPRQFIVSAKPQGIVGKVISREDTHYYGPNGIVVNNTYKDNALTIAVERGTVVRGQPIKGRIFVEFMAPDTQQYLLPVDKTKNMWKTGVPAEGNYVTTWDYDTRRYRQAVGVLKVTGFYQKLMPRIGSSNSATKNEVYEYEIRYIISQDADTGWKPYMSMNARGLNWLSVENNLAPGEVKVYAPAMEMDITTPAPKATHDRSSVNVVVGAMRLDVDLRQPRNFRANDVREKVTPMEMNVTMLGLGKTIKVEPMEITITAGANARAFGDGDRIYVYMDGQNEVTLFMKED